jgi:putative peptidoglycan lipid II flippase
MFVLGRLKVATAALAGSWLLVIAAEVTLALLAPPQLIVAALALGSTIGQTAVAIPLVIATRRIRGQAAVQGVTRAALAGLAAAAVGGAVGAAVSVAMPAGNKLLAVGAAAVAASCAVIAFGVVANLLDDGDLWLMLARARQAVGLRR